MSQQKENTEELRNLKSKVAEKPGESVSTKKAIVHEFRYTGNKNQHELNQSVVDHMEKALVSNDLEGISQEITEDTKLLLERNKHLLLADKYGWDTVECYTAEPLASSSEDEKRIKCALKDSKSLRSEKESESS